jgi:hypothetical protein
MASLAVALRGVRAGIAGPQLLGKHARAMSVQATAATYTKRGSPITMSLEEKSISAPSGAQVQVKFLAASVSYADFTAMSSRYAHFEREKRAFWATSDA